MTTSTQSNPLNTIAAHQHAFKQAHATPSAIATVQLQRAEAAAATGDRTFLTLNCEKILSAALLCDAGIVGSLAGITISIKDLFGVAGECTSAGAAVLALRDIRAAQDCEAVARLRSAGAILFGRTNMVEFAYAGVGLNPHFGTPLCIWDREVDGGVGRIPGGSSSGAAVSVAMQMSTAALGTDTGGSVRIPAALNGLVGFKPTARRVPISGVVPLSPTLDSVGPLAASVDCCARIDAVLAMDHRPRTRRLLRGARFLLPRGTLWNELDLEVKRDCEAAVARLEAAGAEITRSEQPLIEEYFQIGLATRIVGPESLAWHRANIGLDGVGYDPRVWKRMQLAASATLDEYIAALAYRRDWIGRMQAAMAQYDGIISPTVPCVAPRIALLLNDDAAYLAANARVLRNTAWVNFLDGCALTIPCHAPGTAPVGLQLTGLHDTDAETLALGVAMESVVRAPLAS